MACWRLTPTVNCESFSEPTFLPCGFNPEDPCRTNRVAGWVLNSFHDRPTLFSAISLILVVGLSAQMAM
jgi:hypothetical protein